MPRFVISFYLFLRLTLPFDLALNIFPLSHDHSSLDLQECTCATCSKRQRTIFLEARKRAMNKIKIHSKDHLDGFSNAFPISPIGLQNRKAICCWKYAYISEECVSREQSPKWLSGSEACASPRLELSWGAKKKLKWSLKCWACQMKQTNKPSLSLLVLLYFNSFDTPTKKSIFCQCASSTIQIQFHIEGVQKRFAFFLHLPQKNVSSVFNIISVW